MKFFLYPLFFILSASAAAAFPPYYFSADMQNYPTEVSGRTVREYVLFDGADSSVIRAGDGPFTEAMRKAADENRNAERIPETVKPRFGYTLKNVNMKMLPTGSNLHKGDKRFDSNQYTKISPSTPAAVLHVSADGKYYFVQCPEMRGWIPVESLKIYDAESFFKTVRMPFITVKKDYTEIGGTVYGLGDRLPMENGADESDFFRVLLPSGERVSIKKSDSFAAGSEPFSEKEMKRLAESLLGQPYDWGGKNGRRDCSAYVRDLWRVFGRDLPRNTALQAEAGRELLGAPESEKEFYETLAVSKPFRTLIFFKSHVLLYGGREGDDFIVYHAVNRLSRDDGTIENIAAVVKNRLFADGFSGIWKRTVKITELD